MVKDNNQAYYEKHFGVFKRTNSSLDRIVTRYHVTRSSRTEKSDYINKYNNKGGTADINFTVIRP